MSCYVYANPRKLEYFRLVEILVWVQTVNGDEDRRLGFVALRENRIWGAPRRGMVRRFGLLTEPKFPRRMCVFGSCTWSSSSAWNLMSKCGQPVGWWASVDLILTHENMFCI